MHVLCIACIVYCVLHGMCWSLNSYSFFDFSSGAGTNCWRAAGNHKTVANTAGGGDTVCGIDVPGVCRILPEQPWSEVEAVL